MANNRPKLELQLNKPIRLKLLRDLPLVGNNGHGEYYLYSVQDDTGIEYAWFATAGAHQVIQSQGLKTGSEILIQLVENGKKGQHKVDVSIIGKEEPKTHNLKELMIQSMKEASDVVNSVPELGFRAEDARSIGLSLFIAHSR